MKGVSRGAVTESQDRSFSSVVADGDIDVANNTKLVDLVGHPDGPGSARLRFRKPKVAGSTLRARVTDEGLGDRLETRT